MYPEKYHQARQVRAGGIIRGEPLYKMRAEDRNLSSLQPSTRTTASIIFLCRFPSGLTAFVLGRISDHVRPHSTARQQSITSSESSSEPDRTMLLNPIHPLRSIDKSRRRCRVEHLRNCVNSINVHDSRPLAHHREALPLPVP